MKPDQVRGSGFGAQGNCPEPTAQSPQPTQSLLVELLARSTVYRALSVLLRHPHADTVKWLAAREPHRLVEVMEWLHGREDRGIMEAARRVAALLDTVAIAAWVRQHERIFGHSVQSSSPPYELEYGEEHSHRQPQELGDIAAFYAAFGLQVAVSAHERVDHLVTECEFLHSLLYKQACALDQGHADHVAVCDAAVRRFLADHLGRWGPAFALRLSKAAGDGVLGAVADLLLAWLAQECRRMQVSLGSCDLPLRSPKEPDDVGCAACELNQGRRHVSA